MGSSGLQASPVGVGSSIGAAFSLAHRERLNQGVQVEAHVRRDPYEIRFEYADPGSSLFSLSLARKHFFSQESLRPFAEAGLGFAILSDSGGLAYGPRPSLSLGAELGISHHFSAQALVRYSAYMVFGETSGGSWEANHSFSLIGGLTLWF